ncbi:MAG TPA: substrate-binding domain-containing protein [Flavisolibacter sp.]|nr:substrate-binding domain-containing protein [Flavisolibacter sp.]
MKRVSIKDIAKQVGVVPSTVSFVLNGKAKEMRISDELAERIRAVVKETGYQPNSTAVSLRTGKTKTLGLIVEDISNVFFATLAKTIEDEAYALGYKIVYCSTENDDKKGTELIRMLSNQQVDGYLITPCQGMADEVRTLLTHKRPVVLMDRYFTNVEVPYVLVDNSAGIKLGMEHLINKGYRKIAFITVDLEQIQMQEREAAYKECITTYKLPGEFILKLPYTIKPEEAIKQISAYINSLTGLDAVFFATNYLGVYGLESIKNQKLSIPNELAVICFDDHDIFRLYTPEITIVKQPINQIAITAIQLLMKQFEKQELTTEELHIFKKPELIVRAST